MQSSAKQRALTGPTSHRERLRPDIVREQAMRVYRGQQVVCENIRHLQTMPLREDVPPMALAYVCYRSLLDGDDYYRLCEVRSVGRAFADVRMADTGELLRHVSMDRVSLLLAGEREQSGNTNICEWCGSVMKHRTGKRYCKRACRVAACRQRKAGK